MELVCVDTSKISIIPEDSELQITLATSVIKGGSQQSVKVNGKEALIEDDIQKWVESYTSNYSCPPYISTPGVVAGKSYTLKSVSKNSRAGKNLIMVSTEIELVVEVKTAAIFIPPAPAKPESDTTKEYKLIVTFTDPGQDSYTTV